MLAYCSSAAPLLSLNLSTTTQGAIVKLRKFRTVPGYVGKRGWGWRGISAAGRRYKQVLALEVRNVVGLRAAPARSTVSL